MIHGIYTVRDIKAQAFATPFFAQTDASAIRTFTDWCRDKNTVLSRHPEDYVLYGIGVWDDEDNDIAKHPTPKLLIEGRSLIVAADTGENHVKA